MKFLNTQQLAIPGGIWALGFVSMLMDISSEMIHALLPVYLVTVLGTSVLTVGVIEGIAEATASITKIFSGALSDWLGKRKGLAVLGYGLAAVTKPVFPLATTVEWLIGARFVDRVGKGIRGAPRDALIADLAPPEIRGASFGLRQTLDTMGAFLGPLLAIALMWITANHFQIVFWVAVVPAFLAVFLLVVAVREPKSRTERKPARMPLHRSELRRLDSRFWWVVAMAALFTLARFSEAFLVLRAQSIGMSMTWVPLVLVIMNIVYALSAWPIGIWSDRMDRVSLLIIGLPLLVAADLILATDTGMPGLVSGVVFWGLHLGFSQGLFAALVADLAPLELRGTAYGVFNLVSGLALLLASVIAGALWDSIGPQGTFLASAGFALATLVGLIAVRSRLSEPTRWQ